MKGFLRTIEATIGTLIVIGLISGVGSHVPRDSNNLITEDVNSQLDDLEERGILQDIIDDKDNERLENMIDASFYQKDVALSIEKVNYSSSSSIAFTEDFYYGDKSTDAALYLWGSGQDVDVDLNSESIYSGLVNSETIDLSGNVLKGSNSLSFDNPSGERTGYMVAVEERVGGNPPESGEVYVVRRVVTSSDDFTASEVYVYLWR